MVASCVIGAAQPRSDTHLQHRSVWLPKGDVLIHAGDFMAEWSQGPFDFLDFLEWMKQQPHGKKLVTAGDRIGMTDFAPPHSTHQ